MYRAIIFDRLIDKQTASKKCMTEQNAKIEGQNSIIRLCKKYHVTVDSNRFFIACMEIE
jgi:hypothetical protein